VTDVQAKIAAGMRAQLGRRDAELVAGAGALGWKMGLTVPAVQEGLGLAGPVAGYLTTGSAMADGATLSLAGFTAAMLEPEVAIHVGEGGTVAGLGPAIEIVDIDLPFEDVEPILAGNVFHRAVVLGPPTAGASVEGVVARVSRNGEAAASADAAPVVGDPADVVRFVSEWVEPFGATVEPGQAIIAGSITAPQPVAPGDEVTVDLGSLGSLSLAFLD
jgi:2-keto-4-pentenoate hydratase